MSAPTVPTDVASCPSSYDDVADAYDRLIRPKYEAVAGHLVAAAGSDLGRATVVEVAAGTGALTHLLAPAAGRYLATDLSAAMLHVARERTPHDVPVDWLVADVATLPFRDASVDLVVSSLGPVQDTAALLAEAARVLRPEGRLLAGTWGDDYSELRLLQAARAALGLEQRPVTSRQDLLDRAADASLRDVQVGSFRLDVEHASVADYVEYRRSFGAPPLPSGTTFEQVLSALAAVAADEVAADGRLRLGWQFWLLSAGRPSLSG